MQTNSERSRLTKGIITTIIIMGIFIIAFAWWTYPRTILSLPVSFTVGASTQEKVFEVPALDDSVQVQVKINNGASLWQASILGDNSTTIWSHQKAQSEQTVYSSEYFSLASGNYTLVFATIGAGSLDAQIEVEAKGGFW